MPSGEGCCSPGGTIVEPTSGNTGTGLAIAAAILGYRCVFVMPDKVSSEKVALLRAYGAEVVTTPTAVARESPESYYSVADRLAREIPQRLPAQPVFQPGQPRRPTTTPPARRSGSRPAGSIDAFVAGVGTGGTITGIGRYLKERNPDILIVGADPEGSIYTQDKAPALQGRGHRRRFHARHVPVRHRGPLVHGRATATRCSPPGASPAKRASSIGGSARHGDVGGAATGAGAGRPSKTIVVLLPDTGRGYLSKVFNDDWMRENGFLDRLPTPPACATCWPHPGRELPALVTVPASTPVREVIELLASI